MTTSADETTIDAWRWPLAGEEAMVAMVVARCLRDKLPIDPRLQRLYALMLEKQRKLISGEKTD